MAILPPFDARQWSRMSGGFATVVQIGGMRPTVAAVAARQGKALVSSSEAFSTRTCRACLTVNNSVGSSKTFACSNCGLLTRRDLGNA
jgi:hypothetical protein